MQQVNQYNLLCVNLSVRDTVWLLELTVTAQADRTGPMVYVLRADVPRGLLDKTERSVMSATIANLYLLGLQRWMYEYIYYIKGP